MNLRLSAKVINPFRLGFFQFRNYKYAAKLFGSSPSIMSVEKVNVMIILSFHFDYYQ